MRSRRSLLPTCLAVAFALAAPLAGAPGEARAQDWDVKRDPFDRKLVARYKQILARNPGDRDALTRLTRLYRRYRSVELLVDEYEKALAASPKDFSNLVILGHLHLGENRRDQALSYYEKAAAIRPTDTTVQMALANLYRRGGEADKAEKAYEKALEGATRPADKKEILRALADLALDRGDIDRARQHFASFIALEPRNAQLRLDLADALLRHKRHDEAIAALREAEGLLHGDPMLRVEVVSRIGAALEAKGDDDAAVREYRRAMSMTSRGYYLRRELTARIIEVFRRRQELRVLLEQVEKEWPAARRDHFEWDVLARLYEEVGLQDKAIDAYRAATRRAPHELDTHRRLITLLENAGREDEALRQFETVIRVAPGEPRFQLELAERYRRRGQEDRGLALLRRVAQRFSSDAGVYASLADIYARWGKEDLALQAYARLVQIEPSETSHLVNLGEQYWIRNEKKRAIATWQRIISRRTPQTYARLAEVYAEHDLNAEALEMYNQAIKLDPKAPDAYRGRASVYERQRLWERAMEDWERVLALTPDKKGNNPQRVEARRRVVNLLKRAGGRRLQERIAQWSRAFDADPPDLAAGDYLVEAYMRDNEHARARAVLERILTVAPDDLDAMQTLVKVYRAQREYDRAIAILLQLAERSPAQQRQYYNEIAEIKTILNRDDEAIEYAHRALEGSPNDPVAHQRLAERYEAMQQDEFQTRAIAAYQKTIELDPRNFSAYFALARLYRNRDQRSEAAELYREVLRSATDDQVLHRAGRAAINLEELTRTLGDLERVVAPLAFSYGHKEVYRRVLVELYERYVPGLVSARRRGSRPERDAAEAELARLGEHGLAPLLQALSDERDVGQQRIAVRVLGYLGNRGAAAPLVKLARQAPEGPATGATPGQPGRADPAGRSRIGTFFPTLDWDVRVEALVAAGRLGDPRTIPDLIELTGHRESSMREAAVFALGMTGDRRAIAPLTRSLDDNLEGVQMLACVGLAHIGDRKAVPRLAAVARDERKNETTRAACAFALGVLGDRSAVAPLAEVLAAGNGEVQRVAAWALGRIGDRSALPRLLEAYFGKRERVRRAVAWAMPQVSGGSRDDRDPATGFIDYPMRNGKFDARAALRDLLPELAEPPLHPDLVVGHEKELTEGIRHALGRHRDVVVRTLEDLDAREGGLALGPLTANLDSSNAKARKRVEATLERIGTAVAPDLVRVAGHRDPMVRRRALSVLGKTGSPGAQTVLAAALEDDADAVREAAIAASADYVVRRGQAAAGLVQGLTARLAGGGWQERMAAAAALGKLGAMAPEAALARALGGDPKGFVREAAARALGELGRRESFEALARAAAADHEHAFQVRIAAVEALARVGDARATGVLQRVARQDPSGNVKAAARRALQRPKRKN